jgi:hypothetical protein
LTVEGFWFSKTNLTFTIFCTLSTRSSFKYEGECICFLISFVCTVQEKYLQLV